MAIISGDQIIDRPISGCTTDSDCGFGMECLFGVCQDSSSSTCIEGATSTDISYPATGYIKYTYLECVGGVMSTTGVDYACDTDAGYGRDSAYSSVTCSYNNSCTGCTISCSCSSVGYGGSCSGTDYSTCYITCSKACTQSGCPSGYSCTYNSSSTYGKQYYGGSCNASASTCSIASQTCKEACTSVSNTSTQYCTRSCSVTGGSCYYSGSTQTCNGNYTDSNCYSAGQSCSGCSSWGTCGGGTRYITCPAGTYWNGSSCASCGNGYYCPGFSNVAETSLSNGYGRNSCSNKPSNSVYTGSATSNACPWCCNAGYYKSGSSCAACSGVSYVDSGTDTETITGGSRTRSKSRTCYRSSSPACSTSSSACTGTSSCGDWSYGDWVVTCSEGYYLSSGTCKQCEAGYYCPGDNSRGQCTGLTYSGAGAASCSSCPTATQYASRVTGYWYWSSNGVHSKVSGCRAYITENDDTGDYRLSCAYNSGDYGVNGTETTCMADNVTSCKAGYYAPAGTGNVYTGTVELMKSTVCVDVGTGYWSGEDSLTRTECPAGYDGSDGNRGENTDCYVSCSAKTIAGGTTTVVNAKEHYNGSAYPACTYNVNCNTTYGASGDGTSDPACVVCADGKYSAGGNNVCEDCSIPDNATATGNGSAQDNCPWACNANYYKYGSLCAACSSVSYTNSGSHYCDITYGVGSQPYSRTCYRSTSPAGSTSSSACSGTSSCGGYSYGTCTVTSCITDYYASSTTACKPVGTGYYSAAGSTTRTACTNKPANSYYTGSGGGSNACPWACNANYYKSGSSCAACSSVSYTDSSSRSCSITDGAGSQTYSRTCYRSTSPAGSTSSSACSGTSSCDSYSYGTCTVTSCRDGYYASSTTACKPVGTGYYSADGSIDRTACTNGPANSYYTGSGYGLNACPWLCDEGYNPTSDNQCARSCTAGVTHIHLGTGLKIPLYSAKRTTPSINVRHNGTVCYADLSVVKDGYRCYDTLHANYNGVEYYASAVGFCTGTGGYEAQ